MRQKFLTNFIQQQLYKNARSHQKLIFKKRQL